jgi:hypothetical protein
MGPILIECTAHFSTSFRTIDRSTTPQEMPFFAASLALQVESYNLGGLLSDGGGLDTGG